MKFNHFLRKKEKKNNKVRYIYIYIYIEREREREHAFTVKWQILLSNLKLSLLSQFLAEKEKV